jgi:hypothetical protein
MAISATAAVQAKFDKLIEEVEDGAREGMINATRGGLRAGREAIKLRGTQGSRKRFNGEYLPATGPGRSDGREDTGKMID